MPTEMRQIVFTMVETIAAVTGYHRHRYLPIPGGKVVGAEIIHNETVHAVLFVQNGDSAEKMDIPTEVLAASLILYCINRKIPLPTGTDKRLQKVGDGVALLMMRAAA